MEETPKKERKVTIYSTQTCHFCHMAKEYFDQNGVKYEDINLSLNPQRSSEVLEKSGQMGVPVILVDGEVVVGFNKPKLASALGLN